MHVPYFVKKTGFPSLLTVARAQARPTCILVQQAPKFFLFLQATRLMALTQSWQ